MQFFVDTDTAKTSARRKAYETPQLVSHGRLTVLTQAGPTGQFPEFKAGQIDQCANKNLNKTNAIGCSDIRLKTNIRRMDAFLPGVDLFLYEYKPEHKAFCGAGTYLGVMAQDLLPQFPEAVVTMANGYYGVDYAKLHALTH
jgi:Chaperone of endosialidase